MDKKEREQQRALAEKVAILSDSDIAMVQSAVEQAVAEEQQQPGSDSEGNGESEEGIPPYGCNKLTGGH